MSTIYGRLKLCNRAALEESRKWALYYTTNLLFKTYFKLNSVSLSKNILRALNASKTDMPPLESFPRSHIVTFKYYVGVIFFLEENYKQVYICSQSSDKLNMTDTTQAEENLTEAYELCLSSSHRNREYVPLTLVSSFQQNIMSTFYLAEGRD